VSCTFKPHFLDFKLNVRIIWVILLSLSLAGCIYMIYEVLYKYNNSPVVVSFATEDTPLHQIPFPAITICPEFKYSRQKFNFSEVYRKLQENEEVDDAE
jgi:amiloride-sensitive sodium channel